MPKIGLLMLTGVNNRYNEREKYECLLETAQEKAKEFIRESEFAQNARSRKCGYERCLFVLLQQSNMCTGRRNPYRARPFSTPCQG